MSEQDIIALRNLCQINNTVADLINTVSSADYAKRLAEHCQDIGAWEEAITWHEKVSELSASEAPTAWENIGDIYLYHVFYKV